MNFPRSLAALRAHFLACLHADDFGTAGATPERASVRAFVSYVTLGRAWQLRYRVPYVLVFPDIPDFAISVTTLLALHGRYPDNGTSFSMRHAVMQELCTGNLPTLLHDTFRGLSTADAASVLAEVGAINQDDWRHALLCEASCATIVQQLVDDLARLIGGRSLLSLYLRAPCPSGFLDPMPPLAGGDSKTQTITQVHQDETLVLTARWGERTRRDALPIDWRANLTAFCGTVRAVAWGTAYLFDRYGGRTPQHADMAPRDCHEALRIHEILPQHHDHATLIAGGDLCTISEWERHPDAKKGAGARCLSGALEAIGSLLAGPYTAIAEAHPRQFREWNPTLPDPPAVTIAKQSAIDALVGHMQALPTPGCTLRPMFVATTPEPSCRDWRSAHARDELSLLCAQVGVHDLAERISGGVASHTEIATLLTHLVIHQHVDYVPIAASDDWSARLLTAQRPLRGVYDPAWADLVDQFEADLPGHLELVGVFTIPGRDGEGSGTPVCEVEAITRFGTLTAYYTTVEAPRRANAVRLLAEL